MTTDYPPQIRELLEWMAADEAEHSSGIGYWEREKRVPDHLEDWVGIAGAEGLVAATPNLGLTKKGRSVLALWDQLQFQQTEPKKRETKKSSPGRTGTPGRSVTVNQRLAEMVQSDPTLVSLTAPQFAEKLGCTAAAVKQTETWKKIIMGGRAIYKADRTVQDEKRKPPQPVRKRLR